MPALQSNIANSVSDEIPIVVSSLDRHIFERFGDRKQVGRIDFVVDVTNNAVYVIPRNREHSDCMVHIPNHGEKTIPFQYRYENTTPPAITRIITGVSSYEARTGVRHTARDLFEAHNCAFLFALRESVKGNVHLVDLRRELNRKYLKIE